MRTRGSHSNFTLAKSCPRAWAKRYVEKVPEGARDIRDDGRACHGLIAAYLKHLRATNQQTDLGWLEEVFTSPVESGIEELVELPSHLLLDVKKQIRRFVETWIDPRDPRARLEQWFEAKVPVEAGGEEVEVVVVGRIDRFAVESGLVDEAGPLPTITDWKTGWAPPLSRSAMAADLQCHLYALALCFDETFRRLAFPDGYRDVRVRQVYPRHGMAVREAVLDCEDAFKGLVQEAQARVREWWEVTEAVVHDPTPGHFCQFCAYRKDCPAILQGLGGWAAMAVTTPEEAEEALQKVIAADEARKDQLAALRAWVDERGPVETGEKVLAYHQTVSRGVHDLTGFLQAVDKVPGMTVAEVVGVTATSLAKAERTYPLLTEFAGPAIRETVNTKFQIKKAAKGGDD